MSYLLHLYPGDAAALLAVNVGIAVTVVALLALLGIRLAAHDPAVRSAIGLCALVSMLILPVIAGLPGWMGRHLITVPLLSESSATSNRDSISAQPLYPTPAMEVSLAPACPARRLFHPSVLWDPPAPTSHPDGLRELAALLFLVWGAGAVFQSARFVYGLYEVSLLQQSASILPQGRVSVLLALAQGVLRARRMPRIVCSERVRFPMVVGCFRPAILLPAGLVDQLEDAQLYAVLVHECAHIKQNHSLGGLVQRLVLLLLWPHPLVHAISLALSRAREEVCDNCVLQGSDPLQYARTLLRVAEGGVPEALGAATLGILTNHWRLEDRVAGLLDPKRSQTIQVGWWVRAAIAAALLATGAKLVDVRPVHATRSISHDVRRQQRDGSAPGLPGSSAALAYLRKWSKGDVHKANAFRAADHKTRSGQRLDGEMEFFQFTESGPVGPTSEDAHTPAPRHSRMSERSSSRSHSTLDVSMVQDRTEVHPGLQMPAQAIESEAKTPAVMTGTQKPRSIHSGVRAAQPGREETSGRSARLSVDQLVELHNSGITSEYIQQMRRAGYDHLTIAQLLRMGLNHVDAEYVRELRDVGYDRLTIDQLVDLAHNRITPDYIQQLRSAGQDHLTVAQLVARHTAELARDVLGQ